MPSIFKTCKQNTVDILLKNRTSLYPNLMELNQLKEITQFFKLLKVYKQYIASVMITGSSDLFEHK